MKKSSDKENSSHVKFPWNVFLLITSFNTSFKSRLLYNLSKIVGRTVNEIIEETVGRCKKKESRCTSLCGPLQELFGSRLAIDKEFLKFENKEKTSQTPFQQLNLLYERRRLNEENQVALTKRNSKLSQ